MVTLEAWCPVPGARLSQRGFRCLPATAPHYDNNLKSFFASGSHCNPRRILCVSGGDYRLVDSPDPSLFHMLFEPVDRYKKLTILAFHARVVLDMGPADDAVLVHQEISPV